jgi:hypothetical protein
MPDRKEDAAEITQCPVTRLSKAVLITRYNKLASRLQQKTSVADHWKNKAFLENENEDAKAYIIDYVSLFIIIFSPKFGAQSNSKVKKKKKRIAFFWHFRSGQNWPKKVSWSNFLF